MAQVDYNRININIGALSALQVLNDINRRLAVHQIRMATGKRINSAADDAAGLTIANKLLVKSEGIGVALDNIASARNLMTVAEGHLNNINDILHRMKSLAEQAANDTLGSEEREAILSELQQLNNQIDAEVGQAKWADKYLLGQPNSEHAAEGTNAG
ncbi:MAG TPA: flagellin protein, partial [Candidatus Latescibacteria bacterium]|nr:flagellin protein [Candidatus Latescibacterota bacterium]